MARTMRHVTFTFGLVTVPVSLVKAQDEQVVSFVSLREATGERVSQRLYCGETEVTRDEIVKGVEHGRGNYLTVPRGALDAIAPEKTDCLAVECFVDGSEIDAVLVDTTYYLAPAQEKAQRRGYVLIAKALQQTGKTAICKAVLFGKERLCAVRALENGVLALDLLFYAEDIRSDAGVLDMLEGVEPLEGETEMAVLLVETLARDFNHDEFASEHRARVRALVEGLKNGEAPVAAEQKQPVAAVDLMESLRATLEATKKGKTTVARTRKARATTTKQAPKRAAKKAA